MTSTTNENNGHAPATGSAPDRVSELDRLRLENAVLLRDNLTMQKERLSAELERLERRRADAHEAAIAISREIAERYAMTPMHDRIEDDGRIVRGARPTPAR